MLRVVLRPAPSRIGRSVVASGLAALVAVLSACTGGADGGSPSPVATAPAAPVVGVDSSVNPGSVNAYWLTTQSGVVIVDSSRNQSGGRRVVEAVRATGQPVLGILITHSHPDHVGGLGVVHGAFPEAPVFAAQTTIDEIRTDPLGFYPLARTSDHDFPDRVTVPDHAFAEGAVLQLGDNRIQTAGFTSGESHTATVYLDERTEALFGGDLTNNHATPALIEGASCGWLLNLDQVTGRFASVATIYPGHGAPAPFAEQVEAQRSYLRTVRAIVAPSLQKSSPGGSAATKAEQAAAVTEIARRFPGYPPVAALSTLPQVNVAALARELAAEDPSTLPAACRP